MGSASGPVRQSVMKRGAGGGCECEEGQKGESPFLLHCWVQEKELVEFRLPRSRLGVTALRLRLSEEADESCQMWVYELAPP